MEGQDRERKANSDWTYEVIAWFERDMRNEGMLTVKSDRILGTTWFRRDKEKEG